MNEWFVKTWLRLTKLIVCDNVFGLGESPDIPQLGSREAAHGFKQ